jgi:hypothetical protein
MRRARHDVHRCISDGRAKAAVALASDLKAGRIKNNPTDRSNNSTDFDAFKRLFVQGGAGLDETERSLADDEAGSLILLGFLSVRTVSGAGLLPVADRNG